MIVLYSSSSDLTMSKFLCEVTVLVHYSFFFFSSRRRHTRLQGDWSSDVCSSDLWTGSCIGNGNCAVTLAQPQSVTAVFGPLVVAVKVTTKGRGTVRCTPACSRSRSEERRVGEEGRSRWAPDHLKKKKT